MSPHKMFEARSLLTFECFPLPHLLEAFTVLPFNSSLRVSLLECDGEELCLLPLSVILELSTFVNNESAKVSRQVRKALTATAVVGIN